MKNKLILLYPQPLAISIVTFPSAHAQKLSFQENIGLKQDFLHNKNAFLNTAPKAQDFVTKPYPH